LARDEKPAEKEKEKEKEDQGSREREPRIEEGSSGSAGGTPAPLKRSLSFKKSADRMERLLPPSAGGDLVTSSMLDFLFFSSLFSFFLFPFSFSFFYLFILFYFILFWLICLYTFS
jgi:hypothetical protein